MAPPPAHPSRRPVAYHAAVHTRPAAGFLRGVHRYPLKSAAGERPDRCTVDVDGLTGDRTWACVDADGVVASAKQPRYWSRLLEVAARWRVEPDRVDVTVPGHATLPAGTPEADEALSRLLGRPVRLARTGGQRRQLHRRWPTEPGMIPGWAADARPGVDTVTDFGAGRPDGRFHDLAPVHLVTTQALAELSAQHGTTVAETRWRPNLVLDLPGDLTAGRRIRIGADVVLELTLPTPRCVVPSLAQGPVPADRTLLRTLAARHRRQVGSFGTAACFGWYAEVLQPGVVAVGDPLS